MTQNVTLECGLTLKVTQLQLKRHLVLYNHILVKKNDKKLLALFPNLVSCLSVYCLNR